jgi:hypothetical protein
MRAFVLVVSLVISQVICQNFNINFNNAKERQIVSNPVTYTGPIVPFELSPGVTHGDFQAFYVYDKAYKKPLEIGLRYIDVDIETLPTVGASTFSYIPFPPEVASTQALGGLVVGLINYNPQGHPATFDVPHFDVHLLTEDPSFFPAFAPAGCAGDGLVSCEAQDKCALVPPHLPPTLAADGPGACIPGMGFHYFQAQELSLRTGVDTDFESIYVTCAYEGKFACMEPMITNKFFLRGQDACFPIAQFVPSSYGKPGWFPTTYCVRYPSILEADYLNNVEVYFKDFIWLN